MDSLVSQHPAAYSQFAIQVDAHAFPPSSSSASSSASSSSSRSAAHAYPADAYDHRYASSQRYPPPPSSSSSSQHQHQHASPSLQIQTATPAPHEHEPDEQTAHPARLEQQQQYSTSTDAEMQQGQSIADALTDAPGPHGGLSRPLTLQERELLNNLDKLKFFLATAPSRWNAADPSSSTALPPAPFGLNMSMNSAMGVGMGMNVNMNMNGGLAMGQIAPAGHPHSTHPALNRFLLPNQEYVSCVLWGGLYHITGTDIVRALVFRFEAFGRPVRNMKKFEEGVFSDLRNLKPGVDACLEEPKSPFLDLLFKYQCIRTQKKQKVFYWFSVPHDRLFLDALERDLKREKMGHEPTTHVVGEPALSFTYDPKRSLYEQFSKVHGAREGEGELEAAVRRADEARETSDDGAGSSDGRARSVASSDAEHSASEADADEGGADEAGKGAGAKKPSALSGPNSPFFPMFSLFEGSPTYKQRRKKVPKGRKSSPTSDGSVSHSHAHGHPLHPLAHQSLLGAGMYTIAQQQPHQQQQQQGFREPHVDRFGRDVLRLSAEDMFAAGARGEFGANPDIVVSQKERQARAMAAAAAQDKQLPYPGGLSGPGVSGAAPPQAQPQPQDGMDVVYGIPATASALAGSMDYTQQQQQQSQQQYAHGMHPRPQLEQRHTYPMVDFAQHTHVRTATEPSYALSAGQQQQQMPAGWSAADVGMEMEGAPRTKAFVCPLFSCGRMFKRMEHLRRHLRTHTLERPFQCDQCQKRFSRSDNLAQHVRTHDRRAAAAAAMGQMGMAVGVPDGGEADAEDELETDELDRELQYMSGVNGITSVRMCEVEVQGAVHEVQGDEEGLLTTSGSVALTGGAAPADGGDVEGQRQALYYDSTGQILRASPETSPYLAGQPSPDSQWVSVPAAPLPLPQQQQQQPPASAFASGATPNSLHLANARLDASYHTGSMGDYVTSISAPSHKLTFDHAALYPHELALNGPGPIRRHRSATPSIPRYGESIRRPYSAAMSDSGNTTVGATPASAPNSRSYHPYAMAGHHAVSHSAQSSPMAYTVPLSGGYDAAPVRHAAHSRSSSSGQLQEQMRHMLSLEQINAGSMAAQYAAVQEGQQQQQQQSYAGMYRTDSPMPYSGVGDAYEMEIAHQHQHQHPHQQPAYLQDQYVAQQQLQHQQQSEYYAHPHHSL